MVFSSLTFLFLFLPITLGVYYLVPRSLKNLVLFFSGLLFFAWGEPIFVLLLLFTVTLDYFCGRMIAHFDDKKPLRILFLLLSLSLDIGILLVFKYNSFFVQNINAIFGLSLTDPQIPLPLGISFYTFQSMSYTIDVFRRNVKTQKSYIDYGAYVMLFPQIVAGPIVRYSDVERELAERRITRSDLAEGIGIFLAGLGKKVLLANNIGALWSEIKAIDPANLDALTAWLGILAFTLQIYYDFSGYSDMAIGMGKMMGFAFPKNFDYPYESRSVSEFWRRWHMTLGGWFRDYVYISLGGNRKGKGRTILNLAIVWMLTGFWHGASWNFVLWGLYFGLWIILERLFLGKWLAKWPKALSCLWTFLIVIFGWVLFEAVDLSWAGGFVSAMFGAGGYAWAGNAPYYALNYGFVLLVGALLAGQKVPDFFRFLRAKYPRVSAVALPVCQTLLFLICIAFLVDATYNPFLYFRF